MPNILHRLTIAAAPERVHQLAATKAGIQQGGQAARSPATSSAAGTELRTLATIAPQRQDDCGP